MAILEHRTTVLVNEDTIYQRPKDYSSLLMFGRPGRGQPFLAFTVSRPAHAFFEQPFMVYGVTEVATAAEIPSPGQPWQIRNIPPPWTHFEDRFKGVVPVLEVYSPFSVTPGSTSQPSFLLYRPSSRLAEPEDEYKRTDHAKLWWNFVRQYAAQMVGYTFDQPDFNDNPWLEWVHPPASPESSLFAFRHPGASLRGQQFNLFFDQPRPWKLEAEPIADKPVDHAGRFWVLQRPAIHTYVVPNLVGLTQAAATALLNANTLLASPITTGYSTTVAAGIVLSQTLPAGTVVFGGTSVGLQVSLGSPPAGQFAMPNLVGLLFWEAEYLLKQAGILNLPAIGYFGTYPISFTWVTDSGLPPGYVSAQSIQVGTLVRTNSPMILSIQEFPMGVYSP